jgi:hypothetical protein
MATFATITGRVPFPDGSNPINGEVRFTLSAPDTEGDSVLPTGTVVAALDGADLPDGLELWVNGEGQVATTYTIAVRWRESGYRSSVWQQVVAGHIQLHGAGPFDLATELRRGVEPAEAVFWQTITEDDYTAMIAASTAAGASATAAAASAAAAAASAASLQVHLAVTKNAAEFASLQAALDWLGGVAGRRLQINAGSHTITSTLALTLGLAGNAQIEGVGGLATIYVNANIDGMRIDGPISGTRLLTADYVPGATSLAVANLGFTPQAGDVVQIVSDAVDGANRDRGGGSEQYRSGERVVLAVGCTATSLVLQRPLRFVLGVDPASIGVRITTTGPVTVAAGETITQATTGATGVVMTAVTAGTTVDLTDITGTFEVDGADLDHDGEPDDADLGLSGSTSGALGGNSVPVATDWGVDEDVIDAYTTAMQARVVVMRRARLRMRDVAIEFADGHNDWIGKSALRITGCTDLQIDGLAIPRGYGPGLQLRGTHAARIMFPRIGRLNNGTERYTGCYGISLRADHAQIVGGDFYDCRHGVTSGAERIGPGEMDPDRLLGVGRTVGVQVVQSYGHDFAVNTSPFDTHHDATDWSFTDCRAERCAGWAFTIRGPRHTLTRPHARNCAKGLFAYWEWNGGDEGGDDKLTARKSPDTCTSVTIIDPDIECLAEPLKLSHVISTVQNSRLRSASHCFAQISGDVTLSGYHDWAVSDFDGAALITAANNLGMLEGTPRNSRTESVFPRSMIRLPRGAVIRMDGTGGLGTARLSKMDPTAEFALEGRIRATCPASVARILSTTGVYSGGGEILFDIAGGAAGDSVPTDASWREIAIQSADGRVIWPNQRLAVLQEITSFMGASTTDIHNVTLKNLMRRIVQYRYPLAGGEVYEVVAEKSINTTGLGYCLRYLALMAEQYPNAPRDHALLLEAADVILACQCPDEGLARFGGFAVTPGEGTASAYNAAMCGLGLLAAYRVTNDPRYLIACKNAAQFLAVLNSPNAKYQELYGVTPIPALAGNSGWNGFCDQISAGDTILTAHSTWNLLASKFLHELFAITGDSAHGDLADATRDWGATGVTGFWDFFAIQHSGALPDYVSNNWFATGLTVSDGAWHRRGEAVVPAPAIHTGACAGAATTTITLAAGASATDDAYTGMAIQMTSGAATNKGSIISDYNGTTKVATLRYPFPTTPTSGDSYKIGWGVNTIGSDQMEYGLEALLDTGYDIDAVKLAYETICSWPNADTGAFGHAYNSRVCWTGYFRPYSQYYGGESKAYATQYDVQGIGPLLRLKKLHYPTHYSVSMERAMTIPDAATLADKDWIPIRSTDDTGLFKFTTVGVGTVKGVVGVGILEAI